MHNLSMRALRNAFEKGQGTRHAQMCCRLLRQGKTDLMSAIQNDVLGDDWLDFTYDSLKQYFTRASGTVYVVSSSAYPGLVKVGKTRQTAQQRLHSLNNEAVALPFSLDAALRVHDRHWVEVAAHRQLHSQGLHHQKEFFRTEARIASAQIQRAVAADVRVFESLGLYNLDSLL